MTVGSLFSGIGGLDLGFEWAGFETKWFCEIEEFPRKVLNKHWPDVPIIEDIRNVTKESVQRVDCLIGGFPCQDISAAGKGAGIDYDLSEQEGTRSGLWWEYWRVIRELRPKYVVAENVAALTNRGLDIVLGSLAEIGYDAEWQIVSAAAMGAPHLRERIFIVAYPNGVGHGGRGGEECGDTQRALSSAEQGRSGLGREAEGRGRVRGREDVPDTCGERFQAIDRGKPKKKKLTNRTDIAQQGDNDVPDTNNPRLERQSRNGIAIHESRRESPRQNRQVSREGLQPNWFGGDRGQPHPVSFRDEGVEVEYDFRGVAYGVSDRVGALKGYGNAVVPQVAHLVARAVREHAEEQGEWK